MVDALNFAKFSQGKGAEVFKMTWDEMDNLVKPESKKIEVPNVPESIMRDILLGQGNRAEAKAYLSAEFHEFIDECYEPVRFAKITEADIDKFLKDKPELSEEDILTKLPL